MGMPGAKDSLVKPFRVRPAVPGPSRAHVLVVPSGFVTTKYSQAWGLTQRISLMTPSSSISLVASYMACEWCAHTGPAKTTAPHAASKELSFIVHPREWIRDSLALRFEQTPPQAKTVSRSRVNSSI